MSSGVATRYATNAEEALECFFHYITFADKREKDKLIKAIIEQFPLLDPATGPLGRNLAIAIDLDSNDRQRKERMIMTLFRQLDAPSFYDIVKDKDIVIPPDFKRDLMKFIFEWPAVKSTPVPQAPPPVPENVYVYRY
jgi:hypothetical protein